MVRGIKTFYESNEGKSRGCLVCLASAGRETRQFHPLMQFMEESWRVIALDMPAHGKSWPLPGNIALNSMGAYVDFILTFIKSLGLESPVLLGCGLGGSAALAVAGEAELGAAIVMAASTHYPALPEQLIELLDHPQVSQQHASLEFTRSLIGSLAEANGVDAVLWGAQTEISRTKKADYRICSGLDLKGLEDVRCPVLLVRGEDDWLVDEEMFLRTASSLAWSRLVRQVCLPGVGHFPMQEQPGHLVGIVNDFLREINFS